MSQFDFPLPIDPAVHTGAQLSTWLNGWIPAVLSSHSGASRPSYALPGLIWVDTSSSPIMEVNFYDGTNDVLLYIIDSSTGQLVWGGGGGSGTGTTFQGAIDATGPAPGAASHGDFYISDTTGTVHSSFGAPASGQSVTAGDALVFDGAWNLIPSSVDLSGYMPLTGATMTGPITLPGAPTMPLHAATKAYVDASGNGLPTTGGTMTGPIVLPGDPANLLEAAPKQYVDAGDSLRVAKTGDIMTGPLTLPGAPTQSLHAATKAFVESYHDATKVNVSGGVLTGPLTLAGNANTALQAVPKQQLDAAVTSVQVSTGAPDGNKLVRTTASGKIDFSLVQISGTPQFRGTVDPTTTAPPHIPGHYYLLEPGGIFDVSWGTIAGSEGETGSIVMSDGLAWYVTSSSGATAYVGRDGLQSLGPNFELVASNTVAKKLIDGVDASLSEIANVTVQGGEFGTPNSILSNIYSDVTTNSPSPSEIPGGGLGINRADRQIYGLDTTNAVQPYLTIPYFSAQATYQAGDWVLHQNTLYQAIAAIMPGAFNRIEWNARTAAIAYYDDAVTYSSGTPIVNGADGLFYVANKNTTAGAFNGADWDLMTANHNQLTNLTTGDPHTQYLNNTRGDARYYTQTQVDSIVGSIDHNTLVNLANGDPHIQYLNNTRGDARYYTQTQVDSLIGGIDHNVLNNLTTGDPHTQYLDNTRGDARYYTQAQVDAAIITDHNGLSNLTAGDPHTQYLNNTRGDARYYTQAQVDAAIITDHNGLSNLTAGDPHTQYLNNTRGDARYYTQAQVDAAIITDHNGLSNLTAGDPHTQYLTNTRGDARYYTQSQVDSLIAGVGASNEIVNGTSSITIPTANTDIIATVGGAEKGRFTANGFCVTGGTKALLLKNTSLNHPYTGASFESDTFARFDMNAGGGLRQWTMATGNTGMFFTSGVSTTTTDFNASAGPFVFQAGNISAGGYDPIGLEDVLAVFVNKSSSYEFALTGRGNGHYSGGLFTGGLTTSDADTNGLSLLTNDKKAISVKGTAVSHGLTDYEETNTAFTIGALYTSSGGLRCHANSSGQSAFYVRAYGGLGQQSQYGGFRFDLAEKSGTGVIEPDPLNYHTSWNLQAGTTPTSTPMALRCDGQLSIAGSFITGNGSPIATADAGSLQVHTGSGDGFSQYWTNNDVAHTFTGVIPANVYGAVGKVDSSLGGFHVYGISESSSALRLIGLSTNPGTGAYDRGAVDVFSIKNSGTAGATMTGTENMFSVSTSNSVRQTVINAQGDIHTKGKIVTGGQTQPNIKIGGACFSIGDSPGNALEIKASYVNHGVTSEDETDTLISIRPNSYDGVPVVRAYSDNYYGIIFKAYAGNTDDIRAPMLFQSYVKDGAGGYNAIPSDHVAFQYSTKSLGLFKIFGNGDGEFTNDLFVNGKVSVGGETNPDCAPGGATFLTDGLNGLTFKDASIAHGATLEQETNTYLSIGMINAAEGGARFRSLTNIGYQYGMFFDSLVGSTSTNNATGPFRFRGRLISGTSGTEVPDDHTFFSWDNNNNRIAWMTGNGNLTTTGDVTTQGYLTVGTATKYGGTYRGVVRGEVDEETRFRVEGGDAVTANTEAVLDLTARTLGTNNANNAEIRAIPNGSGTDLSFRLDDSNAAITERMYLDRSGQLFVNGKVYTGSKSTVLSGLASGGLALNTGTSNNSSMQLFNENIAHDVIAVAPTNCFGDIDKVDGSIGGLRVTGLTETETGLVLRGISTSPGTGISRGAVSIQASKKSGTTHAPLSSTETIFGIRNYTTDVAAFNGGGSLHLKANLFTNGFNSTSLLPEGGIGIHTGDSANSARALMVSRNSLDHGMTSIAETNVGAVFGTVDGAGGASIFGFSETTRSIYLIGNSTTPSTSNGYGTIALNGRKKSGTSITACAANEAIVSIHNNSSTSVARVTGNGTAHFSGDVYANGVLLTGGSGGGLNNVVEDTTPQLGGNLDCQGNDINGVNNISVINRLFIGEPVSTSKLTTDGLAINNIGQTTLNCFQLSDSTNVSHQWTDLDSDAFFGIRKGSGGGMPRIKSIGPFATGLYFDVIGHTSDTTETATSIGTITFRAATLSGVFEADFASDANIFVVRNRNTTAMTLKGGGDAHFTGDVYANGSLISGGGLSNIVEDTSPQLGGDLDGQGNDITDVVDITCTGQVTDITKFKSVTVPSYTVISSDASMMLYSNSTSANTITIPDGLPAGTKLNFLQFGTGQMTIETNTDTLSYNTSLTNKLNGRYSVATAVKLGSSIWILFGNLEAS